MAIFSKQQNTDAETTETPVVGTVTVDHKASTALVIPRLSEKAGIASKLNKYIFTVSGKMNKVELRKVVEKQYGVKIARVNMITMVSRTRRFGKTVGKTSAFKKAIVTLTPDSKKIDLVEPS
ncbi:MAG: 50S ribosomal protein L23 [bacterium]|nr:50S ribosomal protein L23 [bacterium]